MRPLTFASLALALALAPALVSAQVPSTSPTYTLTLTAPGEFPTIASNATSTVTVSVALALAGVVCPPGGATVPVTLTATPKSAPPFVTVALEPSVVNITIAQGPHGIGPTPPASGTGDATLSAIAGVIVQNASVAVDIVATAADPGCQPSGLSATSNTVSVFANMTAPPPPPPEPVVEDKGFLPGPGALVGALVAMGAAALTRRKD